MKYNERLIDETIELIKPSLNLLKISDQDYFGEKYKDYISNSTLKYINPDQGGNPYRYKYENNEFSSGFLDFGSIVHMDILENIKAKLIVGNIPTTDKMLSILKEAAKIQLENGSTVIENAEFLTKKYDYKNIKTFEKNVLKFRNYYSYLLRQETNEFFITEATSQQLEKSQHAITSIKSYLNSIVGEHHYEESIFGDFKYNNKWIKDENTTDKDIILKAKAKLDHFVIDHDSKTITLNDLKTTISSIDEFMAKSFEQFHYSRQFSFYLYLLYNLINKENYKLKANVIVISKLSGDYDIVPIKQNCIEEGFYEFNDCLKRIGFHEKYGYNTLIDSI